MIFQRPQEGWLLQDLLRAYRLNKRKSILESIYKSFFLFKTEDTKIVYILPCQMASGRERGNPKPQDQEDKHGGEKN